MRAFVELRPDFVGTAICDACGNLRRQRPKQMEECMNRKTIFAFLFVVLVLNAASVSAQTTQFTHHGNLGFSASGQYDFQLKLYDTPATATGTQQGGTVQILNITVTNGDFTLS
jgi:hypothetical protein